MEPKGSVVNSDSWVQVHNWGEVEYELSICRQLELVETLRKNKDHPDHLVFCQHPPVVTLGRSSTREDVMGWKGPISQSQRGGKATYHGPGQIVAYPIINLRRKRRTLRLQDVHEYLRALEKWLVDSLGELSIPAQSGLDRTANNHLMTGVWVGEKKIACIGIAVKSWITYHGIALNVTKDPQAFQGIHPCGFQSHIMTCVEDILHEKRDKNTVMEILEDQFKQSFHP